MPSKDQNGIGEQKPTPPSPELKLPAQSDFPLPRPPEVANQEQAQSVITENKPALGLGAQDQLEAGAGTRDPRGNAYYPLQQTYHGVPVYGARSVLEVERGKAVVISGTWQPDIEVDTNPTYDAMRAVTMALIKLGMADDLSLSLDEQRLIIYPSNLRHHLAWLVSVHFIRPQMASETMIVDAHDPLVIARMPVATRLTALKFFPAVAVLSMLARASMALEIFPHDLEGACIIQADFNPEAVARRYVVETDALPQASAKTQNGVYAVQQVERFFQIAFHWSSVDNRQSPIYLYTNLSYKEDSHCDPLNAFFMSVPLPNHRSFHAMFILFGHPQTTLDLANDIEIIGHEYTHGIFATTQGPRLEFEMQALNESIADMMGITVKSWHGSNHDFDRLRIGPDTFHVGKTFATIAQQYYQNRMLGGVVRNLADPAEQQHISHYDNRTGVTNKYAHAGVTNLAFYLLANGGVHPHGEDGIRVHGIGLTKAATIIFYILEHRLPFNNMREFAQAAQKAARKLYGAQSSEWRATRDAFGAVGLVDIPVAQRPPDPNFQLSGPMVIAALATMLGIMTLVVLKGNVPKPMLRAPQPAPAPLDDHYSRSRESRQSSNDSEQQSEPPIHEDVDDMELLSSNSIRANLALNGYLFTLTLDDEPLALGRDVDDLPQALLRQLERDPAISRHHCDLWYDSSKQTIYLFNYSANGLRVNHHTLRENQKGSLAFDRPITLRIGDTELTLSPAANTDRD